MKKLLILIGAAAMVAFSFSSCATTNCCGSDGKCCSSAESHK
ncbi:MAG: hypothetical protein VX646_00025 [Verrucomicrobiota bacterium]|nr:hypothetical protein [Verrucomicrobiota bacterium]